jgi:subtilase family protein
VNGTLTVALDPRWPGALVWARSWWAVASRPALKRWVAAILLALLAASGTVATGPSAAGSGPPRHVIVRTLPGHMLAVEREVARLGGRVETELPIIHGFSATVPEAALPAMARDNAVVAVTPNGRVSLSGRKDTSGRSYSMQNVTNSIRAKAMWKAGYTGAGVDIALIDSGVAPVDGLNTPGKVINGPDLSFESQADNLRYLDTFGHGTNIAGIIAGHDRGADPQAGGDDPSEFMGVAPDARLLSIKVADSHGNTDISQVIAAIDWVVQHAHDRGLNVRVLNLSFGTQSKQSYLLDPLALAAEVAWHRGIAVVAAAGNSGRSAHGLADPAYDPYLVAAGAADHHGSSVYRWWTAAGFSQAGNGVRNPDILAPGAHIRSLRVAGSYIDGKYPGGRVGSRYFRGSGSSQAAAVVSGALALAFEQHPSMTPDQAKALLEDNAETLNRKGFGLRQGQQALRLDTVLSARVSKSHQTFARSTGVGTLEGSRGSAHLEKDGIPLQGEQDIFGHEFDSAAMAALEVAGNSWSGGKWNGNEWSGNSWSGDSWSGNEWQGNEWSGNEWQGNEWSGNEWTGNEWLGNEWLGNEWLGNEWAGNEWQNDAWCSASWK